MHDPSGAKPANYAALKEWLTKVRAAETPRSRAVENAISQTVVASSAATLTVAKTGPADFDNLTEAIRKASSGSRILIRPGRYEESIVLDKSLEIAGDGPRQEIVIENPDLHCVAMLTGQATVRGLTLRSLGAAKGNKRSAVDIPQGQLVL